MDKLKKDQEEKIEEQTKEHDETVEENIEADKSELEEKLGEAENKYKRALADYQNLEKRMREGRIELVTSANRDLLLRFLPILDTLILAEQHAENPTFKVVIAQFADTLKAEGAVKIKTIGEKFDPNLMEVVTTTEGEEGIVIQEVRPGYLLHDKLLRPAQVIVGKKEASSN